MERNFSARLYKQFSLGLLLVLGGCSLQLKRADKFLLEEKFEAAEREYLGVLSLNPKNSHAIYGRDASRRGIIGAQLLQVRHLRLAGNGEEALELLLAVMKSENEWQAFPVGSEFSTQREEVDNAWDKVQQLVRAPLAANHPLVAEALFGNYRLIFSSKGFSSRVQDLEKQIGDSGRAQCSKFTDKLNPSHDLYASLVKSYCNHWAKSVEKAVPVRHDRYFKGISITGDIEGVPGEISEEIRIRLRESFESSPWYSPAATTIIPARLIGRFHQSQTEEPIVKVHSYTVQIPETVMVQKMGSEQVPYTVVESNSAQVPYTEYQTQYNFYTHRNDLVPVTRYKTVYYNETVTKYRTHYYTYTEPETVMRPEERHVNYEAFKYQQTVLLMAKLEFKVAGQLVALPLNERDGASGTYHNNSSSEVGLYPEAKRVIEPVRWVKDKMESVASALVQEGRNFWERRYCKTVQIAGDPSVDGENILQCMAASTNSHVADDWSHKFFGIPISQLRSDIIVSK